jgi:methyl-accepting chemotaxis protein
VYSRVLQIEGDLEFSGLETVTMTNGVSRFLASRATIGSLISLSLAGIAAVTTLLVATVTWWVIVADRSEVAQNRQSANLRLAATYLAAATPDLKVEFDSMGNVRKMTAETLPELSDHSVIDTISRATGDVATLFYWEEARKDFVRHTTSVKKPDGTRAVGTVLGATGPVFQVVSSGKTFIGEAPILGREYYTIYQPVFGAKGNVIALVFCGADKAAVDAPANRVLTAMLWAASAAMGLALAAGLFLSSVLTRPLANLGATIEAIAGGNLDASVKHQNRTDVIGRMARALMVLQSVAREARVLSEKTEQGAKDERERRATLESLIVGFRQHASTLIRDIAAPMGEVRDTAQGMVEVSAKTFQVSERTTASAAGASQSVQTVAAATNELAASIVEINRQISLTGDKVSGATVAAQDSSDKISALAEAARRIGTVVNMIRDIAAQTNLLALNATIEAARAGEAGRGFAVVAAEVKTLATQTANATGEISQQVEEIQNSTEAAVISIADITSAIRTVEELTRSITASAGEQSSATEEISLSLQMAAMSASEVAHGMDELRGLVDRTASTSRIMDECTTAVDQHAVALSEAVDTFLTRVAAA